MVHTIGNIAAGGTAADINPLKRSVIGHVLKRPGCRLSRIFQKIRIAGGRIHPVIGTDDGDSPGGHVPEKKLGIGFIACFQTAAVKIDEDGKGGGFGEVHIQKLTGGFAVTDIGNRFHGTAS